MSDNKLSDDEAFGLLHDALLALGKREGETVRAQTALNAARKVLVLLQMGLLKASDEGSDRICVIKDQDGSATPPPSRRQ